MMDALSQEDWKAFADLMHPDALRQFKTLFSDGLASGGSGEALKELLGVSSVAKFNAMSASEVFQAFMARLYEMAPAVGDILSGATFVVLGTVREGADLAHVVYRMQMAIGGGQAQDVAVETLRLYEGEWRTLLRKDIGAMAEQLKASLAR